MSKLVLTEESLHWNNENVWLFDSTFEVSKYYLILCANFNKRKNSLMIYGGTLSPTE